MSQFTSILDFFSELPKIIPHADHQQIRAVYSEVHHSRCSSCRALSSEALGYSTVRYACLFIKLFIEKKYILFSLWQNLSFYYRGLASENPDLVQLKSLLAGLTLPVKTGSSDVTAEDKDGNFYHSVILKHNKKPSDHH